MRKLTRQPRNFAAFCLLLFALVLANTIITAAQENGDARTGSRDQSESVSRAARSRVANNAGARSVDEGRSPARILREARTIFIAPNRHIDSKYLEYKLGKYAELQHWKLSIVKDRARADLVLEIHKRALNYIFSIEEPQSSMVAVNGKVVAINGLVAAEEIAREIIKRMKNTRALPVSDETP